MKAVRFHEFGDPAKVLRVEEIPTPVAAADEVLVKLTARSVNPSDLYTVMGTYGILPKLPATAGNEGAGVIESVGADVQGWAVGDRVTLMLGAVGTEGTWREFVAVKPHYLLRTPDALSDEQATSTLVNYLTVWALAYDELNLQPGDTLLMTAGASHLGRAMLELAAHKGFKVIATVRREEQKQELLDLGAEAVIATDTEDLVARCRELTGGKGVQYAIDAVAGKVGSDVAAAMATHGTMIVYGLMSQEPIQIDGRIIFTEATVRGFWLIYWLQRKSRQQIAEVIGALSQLFGNGTFVPAVDSSFDLDDVAGMLERSNTPGRHGKVVITGPSAPGQR